MSACLPSPSVPNSGNFWIALAGATVERLIASGSSIPSAIIFVMQFGMHHAVRSEVQLLIRAVAQISWAGLLKAGPLMRLLEVAVRSDV
ncbi:MAG TPA: hypothetical protein VML01_09960, partial [Bryobacterales bacterium]|nr:hypothetical protein [Bryobacterales bacterium]